MERKRNAKSILSRSIGAIELTVLGGALVWSGNVKAEAPRLPVKVNIDRQSQAEISVDTGQIMEIEVNSEVLGTGGAVLVRNKIPHRFLTPAALATTQERVKAPIVDAGTLPPGLYVRVLRVAAKSRLGTGKPIGVTETQYFEVSGGRIIPSDVERYTTAVQPLEQVPDGKGGVVLAHGGGSRVLEGVSLARQAAGRAAAERAPHAQIVTDTDSPNPPLAGSGRRR